MFRTFALGLLSLPVSATAANFTAGSCYPSALQPNCSTTTKRIPMRHPHTNNNGPYCGLIGIFVANTLILTHHVYRSR